MTNFERFATTYRAELTRLVAANPADFGFAPANADTVADRMIAAFAKGSYNKDGKAVKATCKKLGIAYTYAGINAFLKG